MAYRLSPDGYAKLVKLEANIPYVYDDARGAKYYPRDWTDFKGYPTIGIGVVIQPQERSQFTSFLNGNKMNGNQLAQVNQRKIQQFEADLNKQIGNTPMSQAAFDILFSHAWNTGPYSKSTKAIVAAIKAKDANAAAQAAASGPTTSKGRWIPHLAKRRAEEALALRIALTQNPIPNLDFLTLSTSPGLVTETKGSDALLFVGAFAGLGLSLFFLYRRLRQFQEQPEVEDAPSPTPQLE